MTHAFFFKRQAITFWKICAFQELLGIILIIEYLVDNKSSNLSSRSDFTVMCWLKTVQWLVHFEVKFN